METFSALLAICAGNSPVTGEFPAQRPVTRSFDVFFDLRLNKRLSKQWWGWWFETPSRPLRRHCNGKGYDEANLWVLEKPLILTFRYLRSRPAWLCRDSYNAQFDTRGKNVVKSVLWLKMAWYPLDVGTSAANMVSSACCAAVTGYYHFNELFWLATLEIHG